MFVEYSPYFFLFFTLFTIKRRNFTNNLYFNYNICMKHIEVVAAIICDDDKIFATQRGYGEWKD